MLEKSSDKRDLDVTDLLSADPIAPFLRLAISAAPFEISAPSTGGGKSGTTGVTAACLAFDPAFLASIAAPPAVAAPAIASPAPVPSPPVATATAAPAPE